MTEPTLPQEIMALLRDGRPKVALKTARAAMRRFPKEAGFVNAAGLALSQMGSKGEAVAQFAAAWKLAPQDMAIQNNLVQALIETRQWDKALTLIERFMAHRTERDELLYQKAVIAMQRGDLETAVTTVTQAIEDVENARTKGQAPDAAIRLARAYNLRAVIRVALGQEGPALADYRRSLELNPNSPDALSNMALILSMQMQTDEALAALERALTLAPRNVNALQRYAIQLNEAGRTGDAIRAYERLLDIAPTHSDGLREFARLQGDAPHPELQRKLDVALTKAPKNSLDQAKIAFGLAHLAERAGDAAQAVRLYARANRLTAAARPVDSAAAEREEIGILGLFPQDRDPPHADVSAPPALVFVVGQPRSGTTLVEQVLSAHPAIVGAGEQPMAGRLVRAVLKSGSEWTPDTAKEFAADYRRGLPPLSGAPERVIDKMPANYKLIGFLATAFPDAVFVHLRRDPRDVAWSMWRSWFPNEPMNYTFDMAAMAREANAYVRYMDHWAQLFPTRIHDVAYEDLVADIEGQSRRLADICGVDWVPDMAAPERNTAAVRTASVNQVRQGVHSRSIGGWRANETALRAFLDGLDPKLWPGL
jgi:tetratricopeptide (TPR) repeat protein